MPSLLPSHHTDTEHNLDGVSELIRSRIEAMIWRAPLLDPMRCDARFLPALGAFYNVDIADFSDDKKRVILSSSLRVKKMKGTAGSVKLALKSAGANAKITEWFTDGSLAHTFKIKALAGDEIGESALSGAKTQQIIKLINDAKPARSHYNLTIGAGYATTLGAYSKSKSAALHKNCVVASVDTKSKEAICMKLKTNSAMVVRL